MGNVRGGIIRHLAILVDEKGLQGICVLMGTLTTSLKRNVSKIIVGLVATCLAVNFVIQFNFDGNPLSSVVRLDSRRRNVRAGRLINETLVKGVPPTDNSRIRRRDHVRLKFVFPGRNMTFGDGADDYDQNETSSGGVIWTEITEIPVFGACLYNSDLRHLTKNERRRRCPCNPNTLVGYKPRDSKNTIHYATRSWRWAPQACLARQVISIIVAMDSNGDLPIFLEHMHAFLRRQQVEYWIFVVNQTEQSQPVNRGVLWNIGFKEARQIHSFDCYIFHDANIAPLHDHNLYSCASHPLILATSVDGWYTGISFDGAVMFTAEHFEQIDGYSDDVEGSEDNGDLIMYNRIKKQNLSILRYPIEYGEYSSIPPPGGTSEQGPVDTRAVSTARNPGLKMTEYSHVTVRNKDMYTLIDVDISSATPV